MKREGRHILETVERYAKPPYDYLTDDMTVPFAIALAEKDQEIERLRAVERRLAEHGVIVLAAAGNAASILSRYLARQFSLQDGDRELRVARDGLVAVLRDQQSATEPK